MPAEIAPYDTALLKNIRKNVIRVLRSKNWEHVEEHNGLQALDKEIAARETDGKQNL